ncbi:hypothetical protein CATRI_12755 [Corynebacterium atrinae]|nr:hypothetical protein [Corynebacterium atrinae]WJY64596.1 hypothetical protein CATRI_12755 [Corynebacterium atrinae]
MTTRMDEHISVEHTERATILHLPRSLDAIAAATQPETLIQRIARWFA